MVAVATSRPPRELLLSASARRVLRRQAHLLSATLQACLSRLVGMFVSLVLSHVVAVVIFSFFCVVVVVLYRAVAILGFMLSS